VPPGGQNLAARRCINEPRIRLWRHEPPGGPLTPSGGFWEFPENAKKSNNLQLTHSNTSRTARKTYT